MSQDEAKEDGRLIAAAWARGGERCLDDLEGDVAFVLWLPLEPALVVVSDPLGLHRFVVAESGCRVAVGTSSSQVLGTLGRPRSPDSTSLLAHLTGSAPPAGRTFHAEASRVEGGHLLHVGPLGSRDRTWWDLTIPRRHIDRGEAAEQIAALLEEAVAPAVELPGTGVTLSSGLDSGAVAAVLAAEARRRQAPSPWAITWSFPAVPEADEGPAAHQVASHLGLRHHVFSANDYTPLSAAEGLRTVADGPFVLAYRELLGEAFGQAASLGITRLLTGAGGDQLFGYCGPGMYGYPDLFLRGRWLDLARSLRRHLRESPVSWHRVLDLELLRPLIRPAYRRLRGRNPAVPAWIQPKQRRKATERIHSRPIRGTLGPAHAYRLRALDATRWQSMLLAEVSRIGSRHGIEARFPLVHPRLWELSAALSPDAHFEAGIHKAALRRALEGRLPASALERRWKIQPTLVFRRSVRARAERVLPLLRDTRLADLGLVDEEGLRRSFQSFIDGGTDESFWLAATAEAWLRQHH